MSDVVILGAGLAGVSAGYHLKDKSHIILEREKEAGGLAKTVEQDGFVFDHTGHLLHLRDSYAKELCFNLLGDNVQEHKRNAWIYSQGVFTRYPFQANTWGLPDQVIRECVFGFLAAHDRGDKNASSKNFHYWVEQTFGTGFAEHFFYPYNTKLWCTNLKELTCDWLGNFVPRPSVEEVVRGSWDDQKTAFGYNSTFYYPKRGGIQSLVNGFMSTGQVNVSCSEIVLSVSLQERMVRTSYPHMINDARLRPFTHLVNTLPLPKLIEMITDCPAAYREMAQKLKWTTVLCMNFGIEGPDPSEGKHWLYFPEKKYPFYRAGFPKNFANATSPEGCYSIYVECAIPGDTPPHARRWDWVGVEKALREIGLWSGKKIVWHPIAIPTAYVIYDHNHKQIVKELLEYLESKGIYSIGRYGRWQYSFMEAAILEGRDVAEVIEGKRSSIGNYRA